MNPTHKPHIPRQPTLLQALNQGLPYELALSADSLYSDYIVYVDESGDHGLANINTEYPIFVLAFCIFHKRHDSEQIVPAVEKFKFNHFGHDFVILHEHEIRKQKNQFKALNHSAYRNQFMDELTQIIKYHNFILIACVIDKQRLKATTDSEKLTNTNPYHLALRNCIAGLQQFLTEKQQLGRTTHILVERRGKNEDEDLELAFRRLRDELANTHGTAPFELIFVSKQANSTGLQFADLVARPIGLNYLRPTQENRAFALLKQKFLCRGGRTQSGTDYEGYGLTILPAPKNERPR